jgi:hypothetical protein
MQSSQALAAGLRGFSFLTFLALRRLFQTTALCFLHFPLRVLQVSFLFIALWVTFDRHSVSGT